MHTQEHMCAMHNNFNVYEITFHTDDDLSGAVESRHWRHTETVGVRGAQPLAGSVAVRPLLLVLLSLNLVREFVFNSMTNVFLTVHTAAVQRRRRRSSCRP